MPRTSVKGQVLADLAAEFTEPKIQELLSDGNMDEKLVSMISQCYLPTWEVYVDGASNQKGSRVGLALTSPKKVVFEKSLRLGFPVTNNEVEYGALLEGMTMVQRMGGKSIKLFSNLRLVVGQIRGEFEAKDERMQGYLGQVKSMQFKFDSFDLQHVPRSGNAYADSLAMLATSSAQDLPRVVLVEDLCKPSRIEDTVQINQIRAGPSWMVSIIQFLKEDILPKEKVEADKVRRKATSYWLSEDHKLHKRSFSGPYLLCVHLDQTESLLEEMREGIYGSHTGGRSLAHRAITQGYRWPNMQREALKYVKKCDQCQRYAPSIHKPGGILNSLSSP